jgi:CRISPR-associated endonuclease Csn1
LARELKQSKEERNETDKAMSKRQRENETIAKSLDEYGLRATRKNIIKWRLYEEINEYDKKLNAICVYCGQTISITETIKGEGVDVEHIIPQSKLFDDSQSNKTLAHRRCNSTKGDMTAYDFMKTKSPEAFYQYVERVNMLYARKIIGKTKRDKLLMSEDKIPNDFIDRQLRESQYIAKKAREILQTICHNVWSTSGAITAELRRLWGWDDVVMNLQMPKYKELGLTEIVEWESEHGKNKHSKEVIKDWTKRDDHRHHSLDALIVACTKQSFIHRFNTLNASKTREDMQKEIEQRSEQYKEKFSLLEKYIISQCPIRVSDVEKAVGDVLISFKSGKKVAVFGKRKIGKRGNKKVVQTGIVVPRGELHEGYIYGKIKTIEKDKPVKYLFGNPHLILKPYIKTLVEQRLEKHENDVKKAIASLKKEPIYLDKEKTKILEHGTCFKDEFVMKYKVDANFNKADKVIDGKIKEILLKRLNKFDGDNKKAFRDVQKDEKTLKWYEDEGLERPILSVRCFTGLSAVVPVKKDDSGNEIGFVKPGNNHHIAIYSDKDGKKHEHVCTFWHAVERKKYGLPVIIKNTDEVLEKISKLPENIYPQSFLEQLPPAGLSLELSMQQNEMVVLGLAKEDLTNAIQQRSNLVISNHLYVIWNLSENDYWFRHHLETKMSELKKIEKAKEAKRYYRCGVGAFLKLNPIKIKIDHIGQIVSGESIN